MRCGCVTVELEEEFTESPAFVTHSVRQRLTSTTRIHKYLVDGFIHHT